MTAIVVTPIVILIIIYDKYYFSVMKIITRICKNGWRWRQDSLLHLCNNSLQIVLCRVIRHDSKALFIVSKKLSAALLFRNSDPSTSCWHRGREKLVLFCCRCKLFGERQVGQLFCYTTTIIVPGSRPLSNSYLNFCNSGKFSFNRWPLRKVF